MAVLSDSDRHVASRAWIRKVFVEANATATMDHTAIKAAIDATDTWIDGQQANYNAALPAPFQGTATLQQKTLLFCFVALKRAGLI